MNTLHEIHGGHDFTGANCYQTGSGAYFPECTTGRHVPRAIEDAGRLCAGCPHKAPCAARALTTPLVSGIWAGVFIPSASGELRKHSMKQIRKIANQVQVTA